MNELSQYMDKIHTTPMGMKRIARNLNISNDAVMDICRGVIRRGHLTRRGKNDYVTDGNITLTIHHQALTIITAHKN
ncbi:DUF3781 domain-containing protein [bacterium]|nr:DUF3781 domain-containing protein [bacterium]